MTARGIHHLGVAVVDLDGAVGTYAAAVRRQRSSTGRRSSTQGVEAASVLVGAGRVELLAPTGDDTPRRPLPRQARSGHASRRLRGRRRGRVASRELAAAGAVLIDEEPRLGLFGLQVAFVHPDAVHGVLTEVVSGG